MEKYVIKRNGEYKPFESFKIKDAIEKSFNSVNQAFDESLFNMILHGLKSKETWAVEEIQDLIEKALLNLHRSVVVRFVPSYALFANSINFFNSFHGVALRL